MQSFIVKVGPLNSLNSLYSFFGPGLDEIRRRYSMGDFIEVKFDLRNLIYQRINITALVTFLSTSRKIREATGRPIELIFNWEPQIFAFLTDIGFFSISKALDIFYWDLKMVGGFKPGTTNPNSKLLYFSDNAAMNASNLFFDEDLISYKGDLKQKIMPNFILRCSEVLHGFNSSLINTVTNSSIELIVNSLVHGQDIAIVGLQRSSNRITVAVSDGGVGFKKSIVKTFGKDFSKLTHSQALLIGSLIQKKEHGLRLAIEEVINYDELSTIQDLLRNDGWVIMSSFDSEIRWQKLNWESAKEKFDYLESIVDCPPTSNFLGEPLIANDNYSSGYWKEYKHGLIGTRITFEIPL